MDDYDNLDKHYSLATCLTGTQQLIHDHHCCSYQSRWPQLCHSKVLC